MGGRFVPPEMIASVLGRLRAPLGVYAVLGNHDRWLDGPRVIRALNRSEEKKVARASRSRVSPPGP
jgi:hypothetical protein